MSDENGTLPDASRRRLIVAGGMTALASAFALRAGNRDTLPSAGRAFELPALPYAKSALAPIISAETMDFHYGKHHRGYVDKLNALLAQDSRSNMTLEELIRATGKASAANEIFNNAAQVWNHSFYWRSLTPSDGGGAPRGIIANAINRDFGDFGSLRARLAEAANSQFGSGWAWLVVRDGKLEVVKTGDAANPMLEGARPLLAIDVWEHAYYIDYRNRKADYVLAVIDGLLDWRFAEKNLEKA